MRIETNSPDRISLGGRIYRVVQEVSVDQHLWIVGNAHKAGMYELTRRDGEENDVFIRRLLGELAASGATTKLLGGLLLPEGTPDEEWTPAIAEETAKHIGRSRGPEDMKTVNLLLASLLLDFFVDGMVSVWSSATSSAESGDGAGSEGSHPETIAMGNGAL